MRVLIAAVAMLAMVLQGCSGDNGSVDPDLQAKLDKLADLEKDQSIDAAVALETAFDTYIDTGPSFAYSIMAEHDSNGTVTVEVEGGADFEVLASGGEPVTTGAWTSTTLMRTLGGVEQTVAVYSDVESPTSMTLEELLGDNSFFVIEEAEPGPHLEWIELDAFSSLDEVTLEQSENASGTYRGIEGEYQCTTLPSCKLIQQPNGDVALDDGDPTLKLAKLRFYPNNEQDTYDVPDTEYAYFGWWLDKNTDDSYDVWTFSGAYDSGMASTGIDITSTSIRGLEGAAEYTGLAAGLYVTKTFAAGVLNDADSGNFTATATLEVQFGDTSEIGTVSGLVNGFKLSSGNDASHWVVTLGAVELDSEPSVVGVGGAPRLTFDGDTAVDFGGGLMSEAGSWRASFHHQETEPILMAPETVTGQFDVKTSAASMIGAFGASKAE